MKKYLMILSCCCLFSACDKNENEDLIGQYFFDSDTEVPDKPDQPSGGGKGTALTKGLVAFYPFEENVNDASGNNLNAYIAGSIYDTEGHKAGTHAAYFDGKTSNYVYVPFSSKLQMDEWTINLWFFYEDTSNTANALIQMGRSKVPGSFFVSINNCYFVTDAKSVAHGTLYGDEYTVPSTRKWHMLTTEVKGNTVKQYLDGKSMWEGSMPNGTYQNQVTDDLYIGISHWDGSFGDAFKGYIDDVRIYNRQLNDNEVMLLYAE